MPRHLSQPLCGASLRAVANLLSGRSSLSEVIGGTLVALTELPGVTAALIVENVMPDCGSLAVPTACAMGGRLVPVDAASNIVSLESRSSSPTRSGHLPLRCVTAEDEEDDEWAALLPTTTRVRMHHRLIIDGHFWGAVTLGLRSPPSEDITAAISTAADVASALIELEDRLTSEEDTASLLLSVLEAQSELIVRLDERGRVRYANPAFCQALGVPATLAIGAKIGMVSPALSWLTAHLGQREHSPVHSVMPMGPGLQAHRLEWVLSSVRQPEGRPDELQAVGRPSRPRDVRAPRAGADSRASSSGERVAASSLTLLPPRPFLDEPNRHEPSS